MAPGGAVAGTEVEFEILGAREFPGGVETLRAGAFDGRGGRVALFLDGSSGKEDLRSLRIVPGATAPSYPLIGAGVAPETRTSGTDGVRGRRVLGLLMGDSSGGWQA